jgi:hypothetical protein
MPDAPRNSMRNAARAAVIVLSVLCGTACSIRQDASGVTRIGIGLWGFGDPPGVNWNLDRPRREVPDLPASRHPELPPRAVEPGWRSSNDRTAPAHARPYDRRESAIGKNRAFISRNLPEVACPLAVRALDRPFVPIRG